MIACEIFYCYNNTVVICYMLQLNKRGVWCYMSFSLFEVVITLTTTGMMMTMMILMVEKKV